MSEEPRKAARAVFLAAIMVISVVAMGVGFAGSATAAVDSIGGVTAEDVPADQSSVTQEVVLEDVSGDGDDEILVSLNPDRGTISNVSVTDSGSFDFSDSSDVFVPDDANRFELVITSNENLTSDITVEVTLNTSGVDSGPAEYTADTSGGALATGSFDVGDAQIEHDSNGAGATGTGPDPQLIAEDLHIVSANGNSVNFGSDSTLEFQVENSSGSTVTIEPQSGEQTVDAEEFDFEIYDGGGGISTPPTVSADGTRINVTVSGDTGMFATGVADDSESQSDPFEEYNVSLVDGSGDDVIDSTGPRLIGIGYNLGSGIDQNSTTGDVQFTIPRSDLNQDVDSSWTAEFSIGDNDELEPIEVPNEGEQFQFTADVSGIDDGNYTYRLELYNGDTSDFSNRVINVFEVNEVTVGPGGSPDDGSGDESDGVLTVDADGGSDSYETVSGALQNAEDGDTVRVENGTYTNATGLTMTTANVTLTAADGASPTLSTSPSSASGTAAIDVQAEGVTVSGLTVERVAAGDRATDSGHAQGIIVRSSNVTVENNDVVGDLSATSNDFDHFDGVTVIDGSTIENVDVVNNDISGFDTGIVVTTFYGGTVSDVTISDNDATNNRIGFVAKAHDGSISGVSGSNNDFTGNDAESIVFSPDSYQSYTGLQSVPTTAVSFDGPVLVEEGDSIKTALDVAAEGATVDVGPGTYNESVTIATDNVTLEGPNAGIAGDSDERGDEATITDENGRLVIEASHVTVDGLNFEFGESAIQSKSGNDSLITNSRFELTGDTSDTYAVRVGGGAPGTDVTSNLFTDVVSNDGTSGDNVNGVVVTDPRDTTVANNNFSSVDTGVNVGDKGPEAGTLVVENNEFSDITQFGAVALVNGDAGLDADIKNNTIASSSIGIGVYASASDNNIAITDNNIVDVDAGVSSSSVSVTINATSNWWGSKSGPQEGSNTYNDGEQGASVSDNVEFTPWLDASTDNDGQAFVPVTNDSGGEFASIQAALDDAESGDTVEAKAGTFVEGLTIDTANVTLESAAGVDNTEIELDEESSDAAIDIEASDVTVDGFTVDRINGSAYSQSIAVRATDGVTISNNIITGSGGSSPAQGLLLTDNRGDRSGLTNVDVEGNEIRNFDHGIAISTQDTGGISGVDVTGNTIERNTIGVKVSDFDDTNEEISATIGGNEISSNGDGIRVLDDDTGPAGTNPGGSANLGTFLVRGNDIVDNTNSGITHEASGDNNAVTADLNWWGSDRGPNADSANGVEGDGTPDEGLVVHDPFLTTQIENIEVDHLGDTKQFAQDVVAPAGQDVTAVGFPGPVPEGYTVGDAFENVDGGAIYEYDSEQETFVQVDGSDEISALDAFIITQNSSISDEDTQVVIEYANTPDNPGSPAEKTIEPGFNLIGAPGLGDAYEVFNGPTDREVLYGTYGQPADQSETALLMTETADSNFIETTFGPSQDDPVVAPYGGYLLYTDEQRDIPTFVQTGATADEVTNSLNQTAA